MESGSKEETLGALLGDVGYLLEELCQSGFDTVHDSTLEALQEMSKLTGQYGMAYLSGLLGKLADGLAMRRHQAGRREDALSEIYVQLNEYLYLCREKTACDRGRAYYAAADGHKEL